mmetsp:Transcript_19588/g.36645  ORF Transcript_19588/g.36645 Transcript_19588/m.36645 type:complete len:102 (-) Transcript_19588:49-354(-)
MCPPSLQIIIPSEPPPATLQHRPQQAPPNKYITISISNINALPSGKTAFPRHQLDQAFGIWMFGIRRICVKKSTSSLFKFTSLLLNKSEGVVAAVVGRAGG